jgi:hypothetical protein
MPWSELFPYIGQAPPRCSENMFQHAHSGFPPLHEAKPSPPSGIVRSCGVLENLAGFPSTPFIPPLIPL